MVRPKGVVGRSANTYDQRCSCLGVSEDGMENSILFISKETRCDMRSGRSIKDGGGRVNK